MELVGRDLRKVRLLKMLLLQYKLVILGRVTECSLRYNSMRYNKWFPLNTQFANSGLQGVIPESLGERVHSFIVLTSVTVYPVIAFSIQKKKQDD